LELAVTMPHMNMKHLRTFLAFVDERSAARAAQCTGITPQSVSAHIAAVEKAAGGPLLERRFSRAPGESGRTQLTAAGRAFYPKALRAMQAHDAMLDAWVKDSDPRGVRMGIASGLLELALDALRNNLSDADQELVSAILVNAKLETSGVPAGRLRRSDAAA